jgi:quinol monooxygenase YgiN
MSITVVIELQVQPDKVEELKGTMKAIAPDARAYDGCQGVTVHQDQDNPNTLLLLETWASRPHHEKYLAWRTETGVLAGVVAVLTAPPSIRHFDSVDA